MDKHYVAMCVICGYEWNESLDSTGICCQICGNKYCADSDAFRDSWLEYHYQNYTNGTST